MIRLHSVDLPAAVYQVENYQYLPAASGQVRWNGNTKQFEVCDTNGIWLQINNSIELRNSKELTEVLEWAKKKMNDEKKLDNLAKDYPVIRNLKEKLDMIVTLVEDNESNKVS